MDIRSALFNLMALFTWLLQGAILLGMYKRKLTREFRVFFAYVVFTLFIGAVEFVCLNYFGFTSKAYFVVYWLGLAIHIVLMFFVIQEVYSNVLFRYEGLRTLSR